MKKFFLFCFIIIIPNLGNSDDSMPYASSGIGIYSCDKVLESRALNQNIINYAQGMITGMNMMFQGIKYLRPEIEIEGNKFSEDNLLLGEIIIFCRDNPSSSLANAIGEIYPKLQTLKLP